MSGKTIVIISDLDDPKHGEITVVEGAHKAARLVETLLEAGFEQQRIRIFTGDEMDMQVTHRPVVALISGGSGATDAADQPEQPVEPEATAHEDGANRQPAGARTKAEVEAAEPLVKDGIRFSTMFRPG